MTSIDLDSNSMKFHFEQVFMNFFAQRNRSGYLGSKGFTKVCLDGKAG